jgi:hypothetical protein
VDEKDKGTVCQNLTEVAAHSPEEVFRLLQLASTRSHISATRMNKQSKYGHGGGGGGLFWGCLLGLG